MKNETIDRYHEALDDIYRQVCDMLRAEIEAMDAQAAVRRDLPEVTRTVSIVTKAGRRHSGPVSLALETAAKLDFVVGSLHRLPSKYDEETFVSWNQLSPSRAADLETESTLAMIGRGRAHVVGHVGRVFIDLRAAPCAAALVYHSTALASLSQA